MKADERSLKIQNGQDFKVYDFLGSHLATRAGKNGAYFRVYAPHAKQIYVVGDFNDWDRTAHPLKRIKDTNVWEVFVEKAKALQKYKYIVIDSTGKEVLKGDPYAFYAQNMSNDNDFSSFIYDIDGYSWKDSKYLD